MRGAAIINLFCATLCSAALVTEAPRLTAADLSQSYTSFASKLHDDLLDGYVKSVPPRSERLASSASQAGTDVALQIRFFKVRAA